MLNKKLETYFTANGMSPKSAESIETETYRIALNKYQGGTRNSNNYLDVISTIVEEYYNSLHQNDFHRKNEMIIEIIKTINKAFEKDETILENVDLINQFIKQIMQKYKEMDSLAVYENLLNTIKAFINCKRKHDIFAKENESPKIVNKLLKYSIIDVETLNAIIESLTIFANGITEPIEDDVLKSINKMMIEGLEAKRVRPAVLMDSLDAICNVLSDYSQKRISEDILKDFFITIIEDTKMFEEQKSTIEMFFENLQSNARDINANSKAKNVREEDLQESKKGENSKQKKENIPGMVKNMPFNLEKILSLIKDPVIRKRAAIGLAAIITTGGVNQTYRHFIAKPNVAETSIGDVGNQKETEQSNQGETGNIDESYFLEEDSEYDSETYKSNTGTTQNSENFYQMPAHIYAKTTTNFGAHGPKEGTEVVAMLDANGDIYKIKYIDENGELQEITNPLKLDVFKEYLDTNEESYIGVGSNNIENSVEPEVHRLSEDYSFTINNESSSAQDGIDYTEYEEIDSIETQDSTKSTEESETENVEEKITLKKGDLIFGFPIVINDEENGSQVVIRYENSDGIKQDIPLMYFEDDRETYDYTSVLKNELYSEYLKYVPEESMLLFDEIHDKGIGVVEEGATIQLDFIDKEHAVALCNGNLVGYLDEKQIEEQISEYDNSTYQDSQIEKIVDEHYPEGNSATEQYYNAIRIPSDADLVDAFINAQNEAKMPNTNFNDIEGTIIEIDPDQSTSDVLKKIGEVLRISGKPFGIECSIENEEELKRLSKQLDKIKKSQSGTYFQLGVMFMHKVTENRWVYGYYGEQIENDAYTQQIKFIKDITKKLQEEGIPTSFIKTADDSDNISIECFKPEEIEFTLVSPRTEDNEFSEESQEYYKKLIDAGFYVANRIDPDSQRVGIDDKIINDGIKTIAIKTTKHPEIPNDSDIGYDEFESQDNVTAYDENDSEDSSIENDDEEFFLR